MARYAPKGRDEEHFSKILISHGHKVTGARIAIMRLLSQSEDPLSTRTITKRLTKTTDPATTYRNLKILTKSGILRRIDFHHDHAHFEMNTGSHHHHAICTSCGKVEDIDTCTIEALQDLITPKLCFFTKIDTHSLEFFGICNQCKNPAESSDT